MATAHIGTTLLTLSLYSTKRVSHRFISTHTRKSGTTYSIPLHGVLRGEAAELADGDSRVGRVAEAVRVGGSPEEDLGLGLECLVEAGRSGCRSPGLRGRRSGRGRRWSGCSGAGLALRVVGVELHAGRSSVADGGSAEANTLHPTLGNQCHVLAHGTYSTCGHIELYVPQRSERKWHSH